MDLGSARGMGAGNSILGNKKRPAEFSRRRAFPPPPGSRGYFTWAKLLQSSLHGALRHNGDEVRAVFGAGVQVVVQSVGLDLDARHRLRRELRRERLFHIRLAESAPSRAAHSDPRAAPDIGDEDADDRKARG